MATREPHVGKPHLLHQLLETRVFAEMAALPWLVPTLTLAPRGDGHPVLLLPGFMADEGTLVVLKLFLDNRGYDVQTWGFGRNVGFSSRRASALQHKIRYMHHKSGRKVSLVGWWTSSSAACLKYGRIKLRMKSKEIDLRVSTVPTMHGESVVMRVLDKGGVPLNFDTLGFQPETLKLFLSALTQPHGIVLVTGPTGSGKTTTLYTPLQLLNKPDVKILTVEDPVEYQMEGINQIQVKPQIG